MKSLVFALGMFWTQASHAMDPFTVAMVVGSAASAIGEIAGEASGSAEAFTELYSEVNSDAQISEDGEKIIHSVQEIQSLAQEAGYTAEELDRLGHQDPKEMQKLASTLRAITRAVRAGKKAVKLIMKLEQKAQTAEVETAQIEKEQLIAMYRMIRLTQEANLAVEKRKLQDLVDKKNQVTALRGDLAKKGVKTFGATGVLSFPKSERIIETALEVAKRTCGPLQALMLLVFFARLIFYQFGFFGVDRTGDLLRDTLVCSFLFLIYPELVRATTHLTMEFASSIGDSYLRAIDVKNVKLPDWPGFTTDWKLWLTWVTTLIQYGGFVIIEFVMNFGLAFMVMLFPLVIFASQMMNFSVAWPLFLGSFITLSLWPIFWNLVGYAAVLCWGEPQKTLAQVLYQVLFSVLQLISPLIGIKLLSGQSISRAISSAAQSVASPVATAVKTGVNAASNFSDGRRGMMSDGPRVGLVGRSGLPSAAKLAGAGSGFLSNQLHHRKEAARTVKEENHSKGVGAGVVPGVRKSPAKAFLYNSPDYDRSSKVGNALQGLKPKPMGTSRGDEMNSPRTRGDERSRGGRL
jgi:hypothetical protein